MSQKNQAVDEPLALHYPAKTNHFLDSSFLVYGNRSDSRIEAFNVGCG